jgi:hypothetical protein
MPDYSKTIIYKLWSDNLPPDQIYWGSTVLTLNDRLNKHECDTNECTSRQIIQAGSYHIKEVEKWPCKNKKEALWRERWWIENNPHINKRPPIVSKEEKKAREKKWCEDNAERHKKKNKEYRENNADKLKAYFADHYQKNKTKKIAQNRKYAQDNAERLAEQSKQRYENNREAIIKRNKEKVECLMCGTLGCRSSKSLHTSRCYTRFCKAFDIDADFKGVRGVTSE